jgi:5-methylcytosine-specific restriction endonuclease McrA
MHLTKLELQEMLREMGVKFSHTESYENLKKLFQTENHIRWMGKIQSNGHRSKGGLKRVIRKKVTMDSEKMVVLSSSETPENNSKPALKSVSKYGAPTTSQIKTRRKQRQVKSEATTIFRNASAKQELNVTSEQDKNIFSTVLRRSRHCCELCGHPSESKKDKEPECLKPFHIIPLALGGQTSIKNVVALCGACHRRMSTKAQPSDLKQLKRKARGRIIRSIKIQRKPRLDGT